MNDHQEITHFIGIKRDITARRQMEEQLRQSKERSRSADRMPRMLLPHQAVTRGGGQLCKPYRRLRSPLPAKDREAVGSFQETEQVWQAWLRTVDVARTVDARVILFQCPKSFLPTSENLINFSAFFRRVGRDRIRLAFEPRGETWTEDIVQDLCAEHELIHCVDPFEAKSVHGDIRYWRLHGRGSYSYRYTDADLAALKQRLIRRPQPGYLMFNNFSSKADALRFRQHTAERPLDCKNCGGAVEDSDKM